MGAAAAEIPRQGFFNLAVGGLGILIEQSLTGHDHAVDAVAALDGLFVDEGLLDFVHILGVAQAFDGRDRFVLRRANRRDAGTDRDPVHDHRASTALGQAAAVLGAIEF